MNYSIFVKKWAEGLYSEISYWEHYIKTEGVCNSHERFLKLTDSEKKFQLEELLPEKNDIKFIDIGSGPFSRCGRVTNKCRLEIICVDPLGNIYERIKNKYGIDNGNKVTRGFVELLDKQFGSNCFDIVHMSNSLDHCFDPIYGIYQMINICKIGGKVVLRHHENEALRSEYNGLHQWNLSLHNEEDSFVIWNETERIDVCKEFSEYVEFKLIPDITERDGVWIYNQVEMIKKRDITIPRRDYIANLLFGIFDELTDLNYGLVENAVGDKFELKRINIIKQIESGIFDQEIINAKRNVIWGYGKVGKALTERARELNVAYIITDKNDFERYLGNKFIPLNNFSLNEDDSLWITFKYNEKKDVFRSKKTYKLMDWSN